MSEKTITKPELLAQMEEGYQKWTALLAEVGEERMLEKGVMLDWTVKDIIAHINTWQVSLADRIKRSQAGEPYTADPRSTDERNALYFRQNQNIPLTQVLADNKRNYQIMVDLVKSLSEEELNTPGHFNFTGDSPVWLWFPGDVHEHYQEHGDTIRQWLNK